MIASGFGINAKLVALGPPRPGDRAADDGRRPTCRRFRSKSSTCTSSPPTAGWWRRRPSARIYQADSLFVPWNDSARAPALDADLRASTRGRTAAPCPGQIRPFQPAPCGRHVEPRRRRLLRLHLKLDRDDGDQFLGDLNFTDAARLHRRPARDQLLPGGVDRAPRRQRSGRAEQAAPSCPASSQIGTTNVAAGPGRHPVPRGRQDVPGRPVQGRAAQPRRDHARPRRSLRLRHRRRAGRAPRRPADRPGHRRLRHRSPRSSAASRSGCARSRSTSTSRTSRSTRPTAARSRSTRRGSATRGRSPTSPPTSTPSTARRSRSSRG